jgi:hypothetical protein
VPGYNVGRAQYQYAAGGWAGADAADDAQALAVEIFCMPDDDARSELHSAADGVMACGLADDLQAGQAAHGDAEGSATEGVIVDDEQAGHAGGSFLTRSPEGVRAGRLAKPFGLR